MGQRFATQFTQFIPKAAVVLLLIQLFSSISFGILFTILSPFVIDHLHLSNIAATKLTTSFLILNFALHLVGGLLGGRLVSYRILFIVGITLQIIACLFLTVATTDILYFSLTAFLVGSGLNFPCINCMLMQLFKAEDKRREIAFLWNYSGISLGVLISLLIINLTNSQQDFTLLLLFSAISNIIVLLLVISNWRKLADRTTLLLSYTKDTLVLALLKSVIIQLVASFKNKKHY